MAAAAIKINQQRRNGETRSIGNPTSIAENGAPGIASASSNSPGARKAGRKSGQAASPMCAPIKMKKLEARRIAYKQRYGMMRASVKNTAGTSAKKA